MEKANIMNQSFEKTDLSNWYKSVFNDFIHNLNGSNKPFLTPLREAAMDSFSESGFPTTDEEEWKYTNISPLLKYNFVPSVSLSPVEITKADIEKHLVKDLKVDLLVFVNGKYNRNLSSIGSLPANIVLDSLDSVLKNNPQLIEKYLSQYITIADGFSSLNTAFINEGAVIIIPDGIILEKPIQLLFISGHNEKNVLVQPRNLIIAGKNSQAKIIETYASIGEDTYLINSITEVLTKENSILELYKVQNENNNAFHINRTFAHQQHSSIFSPYTISIGGSIVRNDLQSVLADENCECHLYGMYLGDGKRHIDNHTLIDHATPHCHSNELYKGILDERSRGVFNGKVIVRKDAQKTLAYQSNKNLLLSKNAKVNTKPQLEIFADDVKCSHGATVGQLDKELIFYLQSRGISKDIARSILIKAFASDVLNEIKIEELRNSLNEQILERLHQIVL